MTLAARRRRARRHGLGPLALAVALVLGAVATGSHGGPAAGAAKGALSASGDRP